MRGQMRLLLRLLLVLGASDSFAQQSAWPDNWLFFPRGRAEKVYRLDDPAPPASRVLEVVTDRDVGDDRHPAAPIANHWATYHD